jgi:hypothetical protein
LLFFNQILVFFVASLIKSMTTCRIDIKNNNQNSIFLNQVLKVLVACYVILASAFLLYKLYSLPKQQHTSTKEWLAVTINFIIIIILTLQLLKTSIKRFILITDEFVKYRFRFPWTSKLKWENIKTIQLGYSTVRFITKSDQKHRFNFSKAKEQEKTFLEETLISIAQKNNIEFMQPS